MEQHFSESVSSPDDARKLVEINREVKRFIDDTTAKNPDVGQKIREVYESAQAEATQENKAPMDALLHACQQVIAFVRMEHPEIANQLDLDLIEEDEGEEKES